MRPRSLAILAAFVVALAAFIWFFERDLPSSDERAELAKRVVQLEADEVRRLVVEWDDIVVELVRSAEPQAEESGGDASAAPAGWRIERPLAARADTTAVDGLLDRLVELEKERTLEDVAREDVGLGKPRGRVTLVTETGETLLEIGAGIPASSNMTLGVEGFTEVFVVRDAIWETLTKEPGEWRDKRLFLGDRASIEGLTILSDGRVVELIRRDGDFWIAPPVDDLADKTEVGELLATVTALRADSFVDDLLDLAALGLDPAEAVVEVKLAGGENPLRLEIGLPLPNAEQVGETASQQPASSPARYLRLDGQVVTTTAALADHLERQPEAWRSLDWVTSEAYDVGRLRVTDAEGEHELRRENGDWLRDGERIAYGPAADLLHEITGATAIGVLETDPASFGAPAITLVLESQDGAGESAWIYAAGEQGSAARVSGREAVLLLSPETVAGITEAIREAWAAEPDVAGEGP